MVKSSEAHKARRREIARKNRNLHYNKVFARSVINQIPKKPCEVCGDTTVEAHHDDYNKPYSVRWLCKLHHEEVDTELDRRKKEVPHDIPTKHS